LIHDPFLILIYAFSVDQQVFFFFVSIGAWLMLTVDATGVEHQLNTLLPTALMHLLPLVQLTFDETFYPEARRLKQTSVPLFIH